MMLLCATLLLPAAFPQALLGQQTSTSDSLIEQTSWTPNLRPDSRGFLATPAGPVLDLGHVRLSIDHKRTEFEGLRQGTASLATQAALDQGYVRVPKSAAVNRTDLRAEFGLSENVTVRLNIPFETRRVSYQRFDGSTERWTAQGLADVRMAAAVELSFGDGERAELALGMRIPTGTTRANERSPAGLVSNPRLPYFQQLGGGTYALEPAFYWSHWGSNWSVGAGANASLPMGTNNQGWSLGQALEAQAWISRRIDTFRSIVFGLEFSHLDPLDGLDPDLNPSADPSQDPAHVGGQTLSANFGLHMEVERGHHVALEIGAPVAQDLNGPQLEEDYHFRIGWWYSF